MFIGSVERCPWILGLTRVLPKSRTCYSNVLVLAPVQVRTGKYCISYVSVILLGLAAIRHIEMDQSKG